MGADGGIYIITAAQAAECPHWDEWDSLSSAYQQTDPFGNRVYTFYWETERDIGFDCVWDGCPKKMALVGWIQEHGVYWEVWT